MQKIMITGALKWLKAIVFLEMSESSGYSWGALKVPPDGDQKNRGAEKPEKNVAFSLVAPVIQTGCEIRLMMMANGGCHGHRDEVQTFNTELPFCTPHPRFFSL